MPPAPGLVLDDDGPAGRLPRARWRPVATTMSVPPPGGNGTIRRIGLRRIASARGPGAAKRDERQQRDEQTNHGDSSSAVRRDANQPTARRAPSSEYLRSRGPAFITCPGNGRPMTVLDAARDRDQRVEVDAGVVARFLEQVDEILGADVAGRAGRERAAAEPRDRRLVLADAELEPDHRRWRARRRACCGSAARSACSGKRSRIASTRRVDRRRRRHAGRVAEREARRSRARA